MDQLDNAEREVQAENTAQAILKTLKRVEEKRPDLGARWIWELLQNARDAANADGTKISIRLNDGELRFRHDGRPFKYKEVAHLIFHGTTKLEEEDKIGQYGSGFISTHLLSRRVHVSGMLEDGNRFGFWLDRSSGDQHDLARAMRRSMDECKLSRQPSQAGAPHTETEFVYPLDDASLALARAAIEDLKAWGPLVLALAPEIVSINLDADGATWGLARGTASQAAAGVELVAIELHSDEGMVPYVVAVGRQGDQVQAAIPLRPSAGGLDVDLDERTPRVFVLVPLLGTDKLVLPAVFQSRDFEPFEDRDGIWLAGDTSNAAKNRDLIAGALPSVGHLIEVAAREQWTGIERLLAFDTSRLPEWVDHPWLIRMLTTVLDHVKDLPLISTEMGDWVPVTNAWIPQADDEMQQIELWQLAHEWSGAASRLPQRQTLAAWSRNLSNWALLTGQSSDKMSASFTIAKLARLVSDAETVDGLGSRLDAPETVMDWLSRLLALVQASRQTSLHDDLSLLPSQAGPLRKRREAKDSASRLRSRNRRASALAAASGSGLHSH